MTAYSARSAVSALIVVSAAASARAQDFARYSLESVVAVDAFAGESAVNTPQIVIDVSAAVRVGDRWQLFVRPWFRRPRANAPGLPQPPWDKQLYQAGIRWERPGTVATRFDAGYILSPIGLGVYDVRPGVNPTIVPHISYLTPMPLFEPTGPRVSAVSSTYPLGAQFTVSTRAWDARVAAINTAPTRIYAVGAAANPQQTPVVVAGGGVTPRAGLRLGAAVAHGDYARPAELTIPATTGRAMTMVNGEGEWAFGGTKIAAEVLRTAFATRAGDAIAYEWFVQAQHTIAARWFVAGRHEGTSAPPLVGGIAPGARSEMRIAEATAGYRVTPDVTVRASYYTRRPYGTTAWNDQVGVSIVWAHRWW
jgi:hypothetical protein